MPNEAAFELECENGLTCAGAENWNNYHWKTVRVRNESNLKLTLIHLCFFRLDPIRLRGVLRPLRGRPQQRLHLPGVGLDATASLASDGQRDGLRGRGLNDESEHHRAAGIVDSEPVATWRALRRALRGNGHQVRAAEDAVAGDGALLRLLVPHHVCHVRRDDLRHGISRRFLLRHHPTRHTGQNH